LYIFEKLNFLLEQHVRFIGTYCNDKIIVFRGQKLDDWLLIWLATFQQQVDRLLGMLNIQFTMEVWCPGSNLGPLPNSSVSIVGIGRFNRVLINGNKSFPYLNIKILWDKNNKILFNVYRKPCKLAKYLNHNSHHYWLHKTVVLSGVELRLALLTTRTPTNKDLSISEIYPDKHDALWLTGKIKLGQKMQTLKTVLGYELNSGPARL
jgi:hypothetical protein